MAEEYNLNDIITLYLDTYTEIHVSEYTDLLSEDEMDLGTDWV